MVVAPADPGTFEEQRYSEKYSCPFDGYTIDELEPRSFSFNSPHGACPACTGLGVRMEFDAERVINRNLSISEGALLPWSAHDHDGLLVRQGRRGGGQAPGLLCGRRRWASSSQRTSISCSTRRVARRCASATATTATPTTTRRRSKACCPTSSGAIARRTRSGSRQELEKFMVARPCPTCGGTQAQAGGRSASRSTAMNISQVSELSVTDVAALGGGAAQQSERARAPDRPPGAQGDPLTAGLPGRRRASTT